MVETTRETSKHVKGSKHNELKLEAEIEEVLELLEDLVFYLDPANHSVIKGHLAETPAAKTKEMEIVETIIATSTVIERNAGKGIWVQQAADAFDDAVDELVEFLTEKVGTLDPKEKLVFGTCCTDFQESAESVAEAVYALSNNPTSKALLDDVDAAIEDLLASVEDLQKYQPKVVGPTPPGTPKQTRPTRPVSSPPPTHTVSAPPSPTATPLSPRPALPPRGTGTNKTTPQLPATPQVTPKLIIETPKPGDVGTGGGAFKVRAPSGAPTPASTPSKKVDVKTPTGSPKQGGFVNEVLVRPKSETHEKSPTSQRVSNPPNSNFKVRSPSNQNQPPSDFSREALPVTKGTDMPSVKRSASARFSLRANDVRVKRLTSVRPPTSARALSVQIKVGPSGDHSVAGDLIRTRSTECTFTPVVRPLTEKPTPQQLSLSKNEKQLRRRTQLYAVAEERLFFSLPDQPIDKKSKRNTVAVVMSKSAPEDSPLSPGRPQAAPPPRPTALTPIASSPPVPGIERPRARVALAPPQVVTPKKVAPAVVQKDDSPSDEDFSSDEDDAVLAAQRAEFAALFGADIQSMVDDKIDEEFWDLFEKMEDIVEKCVAKAKEGSHAVLFLNSTFKNLSSQLIKKLLQQAYELDWCVLLQEERYYIIESLEDFIKIFTEKTKLLSKDPKNEDLIEKVEELFDDFESIMNELTQHKEHEVKKRKERKAKQNSKAEAKPPTVVPKVETLPTTKLAPTNSTRPARDTLKPSRLNLTLVEPVQDSAGKWVYEVKVLTDLPQFTNTQFSVRRKFGQFKALFQRISDHNDLGLWFAFPAKNSDKSTRYTTLKQFLGLIMSDSDLQGNKMILEFLDPSNPFNFKKLTLTR